MSRGRWQTLGVAALALVGAASLVFTSVAFATISPTLKYTPPTIKVKDHQLHNTSEDFLIGRVDRDFFFESATGLAVDPESETGCSTELSTVYCDLKGIKKIIVLTNDENDRVEIDLGGSADKVKQIIKGQDDNDDLFGGDGTQKLVGGEGDDELEGGPGKDILIGGPGLDICDGGPGKDTIRGCEPPPMRRFTQPMVRYKPPLVEMLDYPGHNSVENMVADEFENVILYSSTPVQVFLDPDSDPGCDIDVSAACPLAGTEKIVMDLGAMNDSADFRLDTAADDIKQIAKGGAGKDKLKGRKGAQVLKGGEGGDLLEGGDGDDTLIGGPGEDYCDGGKGHDDLKDCEGGKP